MRDYRNRQEMRGNQGERTKRNSQRLRGALTYLFGPRKRIAFISATSNDLGIWRKQVAEELREAGLDPLDMEQFPAMGKGAVEGSASMVERCDVLIGIYARRYGTLGASQRSITEEEYDTAKRKGIPRLCFLLADDATWPPEWCEGEPGASKVLAFRQKIRADQIVAHFRDFADLRVSLRRAADEYLEKAEKRRRRTRRGMAALAIAAGLAGIGWLAYTQTDRYQIEKVVQSAPFPAVDATSSEVAPEYLKALVILGRWELARNTALHIDNPKRRSLALNSVSEALMEAGLTGSAASTWLEAQAAASRIEVDFDRYLALVAIARSQANVGKYSEAFGTARLIPSFYNASQAIAAIAIAQAKAGRFAEALQSVAELDENTDRSTALRIIVEEQVRVSRLAEACVTVDQIRRPTDRATALRIIAEAQAKLMRFEDAQITADKIGPNPDQSAAWKSLAQAEASAGRLPEALSTAQRTRTSDRFDALSAIAESQAKSGDSGGASKIWVEARTMAHQVGNFHSQCVALSAIAESQARVGRLAEAHETWEEAKRLAFTEPEPPPPQGSDTNPNLIQYYKQDFVNRRSGALTVIALSQVKAGQLDQAQSTIRQLERPSDRSRALVAIANALAKAGVFEAAHVIVPQLERGDRADALKSIAKAETEAGEFSQAKRTAQQIQDGNGYASKSPAFRLIAQAEAKAGLWKDARRTLEWCTPADQLSADTAILKEYAARHGSKPKR